MNKCFIIAEAGVNHNGDINIAKKLIDEASKCGADAIKFQTFKAKNVISKFSKKLNYQKDYKNDKQSQLHMLKKLELNDDQFHDLAKHSKKRKIIFSSTPKDIKSIKTLEKIGPQFIKVGSSEINNFEFLTYLAKLKSKIILSTGMSTLGDIETAINTLYKNSQKDITLLHCTSEYPCSFENVNLNAMQTIASSFQLPVGYSDHTNGIEVSLAAVALGAKVIEKHFTLDKNMEGPDHKASLEPKEFKFLVEGIRNVELSLGSKIKKPTSEERKNVKLIRRGLIYSKTFEKGYILKNSDIKIKRPALGLEPKEKKIVVGMEIKQKVYKDSPVKWENFK
tara:strand:+ start:734 stop:1744 length:1011 start_codon:yes stop_codon:yes gene_type:complete